MTPAEIWRRLVRWRRRDALGRELAEELQEHLELLTRDYQQAGMTRAQAEARAQQQLGNLGRIRESSRDHWGFPVVDAVLRDLRYTLRGLRTAPGFTAAVVLTLGLGIGANAVMFGVVDQLMFRPYPYLRDPSRVHRVYLRSFDRGRESIGSEFEYTRYLDLQRWTSSFDLYAGISERQLAVGSGESSRERRVDIVSAAFFSFFDARPALGRFFLPAEDAIPRGAAVVVLGYDFWQAEFGGRNVLGQSLLVVDLPCTIVGVAPRGFTGVSDGPPPALFLPITTYAGVIPQCSGCSEPKANTYYTNYNWGWMEMMVRRKPGVSTAQASTDLSRAYVRSWNAERSMGPLAPVEVARPSALASAMKPGAGPDPGLEARTAIWVAGVSLIVLLIACANVANLFLARALRRSRETAVRVALGVSRGRLLAQCLVESLVLAVLGSAAGLLIAQWGGAGVRRLFLRAGTGAVPVVTDGRTLVLAGLAALSTGILTGLAPAFLVGRLEVADALKSGAREGGQRSPLRSLLLIVQGALSVVLLVGAGLFVKSLDRVKALRLGYDAEPVLLAEPNLRGTKLSPAEQLAMGRSLLVAAQGLPGVEHAAWAGSVPFYSTSSTGLHVPGIDSVRRFGRFTYENATADYFATMGTRIVRGRPFTASDRAGTPLVVVVSETMAQVLWPGRDPLGQCLGIGADTMPCSTVIGVAEDMVERSLTNERKLHYYLPLAQFRENEGFALLLRMKSDAAAQVQPVRHALQKLMPGQAYITVRPLQDLVDAQRRSWRFGATMFVAFGVLALVVAAVGLYGVIAYNVAQRLHELAVRIALGARSPDLVRLVVGQSLRFGIAGVLLGAALALIGGRWLEPLLFEESPRDPSVFGAVGALLLLVAVIASAFPAWRATRADPNTALRVE